MQIIDPKIETYLSGLIPNVEPIVFEMHELAQERNFPIVGALVGRLCFQMVQLVKAKNIFEMGSGFGYSAFWMASALPEDGKIICTESSEENINLAKDFFKRGHLDHKVEFHHGDALEILQETEATFDIVLNDIDKLNYPRALELVVPRLRKGGMLITDNLLWHGRVTDTAPDEDTQAILRYTTALYQSKAFFTTIIPLRDGVGLSYKLL